MIEQFTNRYPLSKTLRFKLIPVGKTELNFTNKKLLEQDEKRAEEYVLVKGYMDRYHKSFIDDVLCKLILNRDDVQDYAELFFKNNKSDNDTAKMEKLEASLRKAVALALKNDDRYKNLDKKEFVRNLLPDFLTEEEEKKTVESFYEFSTYFTGFFQNRANMYTEEDQSTGIAFRCINDNLPKFLDNVKSFTKIASALSEADFEELNDNYNGIWNVNVEDVFTVDYFSAVLSQTGIDIYNQIVGGYTCTDGTKIKGVNEYINLYNQQVAKGDKSLRLPLLKPLFKQILSDRDTVSFLPEVFNSDDEVLSSINNYYTVELEPVLKEVTALFEKLSDFNPNGIYFQRELLTGLSNNVFGAWSVIQNAWNAEYKIANPKKKKTNEEKYLEDEKKAYKKNKSFSIGYLQTLVKNSSEWPSIAEKTDKTKDIVCYFGETVKKLCLAIAENYDNAVALLSVPYSARKRLSANETAIAQIKALLDSVKDLEREIKPLLGTGKEEDKDNEFYGIFLPLFEKISLVDRLYDKVRNYATQKPYSTDKIKLNFENPQFLGGWPYTMEASYSSFILRDGKFYYLAVMDSECRTKFNNCPSPENADDVIEKMRYCQVADPAKDIPNLLVIDGKTVKKNGRKDKKDGINHLLEEYRCKYLPDNINRIRLSRSFSKSSENFCKNDLSDYISYYQKRTIEYFSDLEFHFKPADEYNSFAEFTDDANGQGYQLSFFSISKKFIDDCVSDGSLYLFQIYNKDFSEYSHGKPNLHTLYFKMLFDERNLTDVVYKLNGGSEMFYRKASIRDDEKIVHKANNAIANKNPDNEKKTSTFEYDIVKDKRFTTHQFSLHVPITMNFKAPANTRINDDVRKALVAAEDTHIIGIDRGERNLIYISVINGKGEIVEQVSLNEIISDNNYKVDYHGLLDRKESERENARQSWQTIGNIKELKEGYISQVVHKICELVIKYDAIVAMEDLNGGFMNSRAKVEKQVYQKFEKMLTDKLKFLVCKDREADEIGGLLNAYQLTNNDGRGYQNGIIFYVPAWRTSKIDPTTGFVALVNAKYTSVPSAQDFFGKFDDIRYNSETDMFEFDIDYSNFPRGSVDYKQKWTICTNGDRIKTFRNPEKNSEWDNKTVCLTQEFKALFSKYAVDYSADLKGKILLQNEKDFFEALCRLFNLTVQMRNSITGDTEVDYLISPVRNKNGDFYDSRDYEKKEASVLPQNADANGAFNIARKALWAIQQMTVSEDCTTTKLSITNKDWLEYAQNR